MTEMRKDQTLWVFTWFGFVIWTLVIAYAQLKGWSENYPFQNIDFDPVLRLMRVEQFMTSGDWVNDVFARLNPPMGMVVPWTYPVDILIAAGGWVFAQFMPLRDALLTWGMLLSPILWIVLAAAMLWAMKPLFQSELEKFLLLFLTGISLVISHDFYLLRAADHHDLTLIFQILTLGMLLRSHQHWRYVFLAGICCAMGLWTAIEGFMLFTLITAGMGFLWLAHGAPQFLQRLQIFLWGTSCILIPAWLIEHFHDPFLIEYDRLSVFYVAAAMLTVAGTYTLLGIHKYCCDWRKRILAAGLIAIIIGVTLQYFFPGFYHGPTMQIDPWLKQVWFNQISEIRPLESWQWWTIAPWYVLAYLAIEQQLKKHPLSADAYQLHLWLLIFAGYFVMAVINPRWLRNIEIMALPFIAIGVSAISRWLIRFLSDQPNWWRPVAQMMICGSILYVYYMLPQINMAPKNEARAIIQDYNCGLATSRLAQFSDWTKLLGNPPKTVLTQEDLSFFVIYWTPYDSLIANYHRDLDGFRKMAAIVTAEDERAAHQFIKENNIGALLFCKTPPDIMNDPMPHDVLELSHARWLNADAPPPWLERIDWPTDSMELKTVPLNARPYFFKVKN